jgi:glycosyltransferase involved in cell wall biosynthesis
MSFLLSSMRLSGGVLVIIEYAKRLTACGHEIHLIAPKGTTDPEIAGDLGEGVFIHEATIGPPSTTKITKLSQLIHLTWSLAWICPKSDVIIATHTPTTVPALLASHLLNKGKPVWLYQDYLEMFDERPYERWLVKNALRWFNCALVVSEYSKLELKKNSPGKVVYVGEGLSHAEVFHPLPSDQYLPRDDQQIILTIGDVRPRKGFYDFLDAVTLVYENLPNIELWIYAKEQFNISSEIPFKFFYRPTRSELARLYASCDVFVSASWWESFGLPPLEAMACGAPVVMTDSRGIHEYAIPDENCLMIPVSDPQSLAIAITRVLTDHNLAVTLRQNGPPTAAKFSWDEAVNRFQQAIMDLF